MKNTKPNRDDNHSHRERWLLTSYRKDLLSEILSVYSILTGRKVTLEEYLESQNVVQK